MIFWSNRAFIAHLRAEIAWLRDQLLLERRRSEDALNILLAQKTGAALTVTALPVPVDTLEEAFRRQTPEFHNAGDV